MKKALTVVCLVFVFVLQLSSQSKGPDPWGLNASSVICNKSTTVAVGEPTELAKVNEYYYYNFGFNPGIGVEPRFLEVNHSGNLANGIQNAASNEVVKAGYCGVAARTGAQGHDTWVIANEQLAEPTAKANFVMVVAYGITNDGAQQVQWDFDWIADQVQFYFPFSRGAATGASAARRINLAKVTRTEQAMISIALYRPDGTRVGKVARAETQVTWTQYDQKDVVVLRKINMDNPTALGLAQKLVSLAAPQLNFR